MLLLRAEATLLTGGKKGVKSLSFPPFTYSSPDKVTIFESDTLHSSLKYRDYYTRYSKLRHIMLINANK